MQSPSTSSRNKNGFTLIEILIAMAIMTGIMALGLFMGLDALHSTYSRSERDTVVALLQKARSRALANIDGVPWGVCYVSASQTYVLFAGSACNPAAPSSEATPVGAGAGVSWSAPVVFSQVSAQVATPVQIVLTQQNKASTTTINYEGTIIW